jgi:hypothetical protein
MPKLVCNDVSNEYELNSGIDLRDPFVPPRTDWHKFNKLDCLDRPGLTEKEFLGLFVKCDACELITSHLVFDQHQCAVRKH